MNLNKFLFIFQTTSELKHLRFATILSNWVIKLVKSALFQTSLAYKISDKNAREQKKPDRERSSKLLVSYTQNQTVEHKFWINKAIIKPMWIWLIGKFSHQTGNENGISIGKQPKIRKWNFNDLNISIFPVDILQWFGQCCARSEQIQLYCWNYVQSLL